MASIFKRKNANGRPRCIALCDPVIDKLQHLNKTRNPQKPLVFASKTAFGRIDIKKAWQEALKRANISHCCAILFAPMLLRKEPLISN
jgi:hypothetical protein